MKVLPLLASNRLTLLVGWLHILVSSAWTLLLRFVAGHPLHPLTLLSPSAMALGTRCPWLGWSCSVELGCRRRWAAAGEVAGAHLAPTLGFLPPLSWLQGSLCPCCSCALLHLEVWGKGQLCLLQPLPGVAAWEALGFVLLLGAGSAVSSAGMNIAGHELIFMMLHTAVWGWTALSCHQLCCLLSFSWEVIVVNRHVLHIYGFVLVFLMREEHYTPHQERALQSLHRWPYPHMVWFIPDLQLHVHY